ncbi:zinc-dependent alcohol dehydrogenase [Aestuariivirga sp.]|uniref:zinc-dependent alcohol dehydrogenase n=1 Tax=Aestuariivirga sp. TaxID=2650926 RepID=UPI0039E318F0
MTAMGQMRAAVLVEPGKFVIEQRAIPPPKPDEVLIKVERAGICGTDLHIFHGHYAADKLPLVPGHEFVGVVAGTGAEASRFTEGQRVVVDINVGCGSCFWCRRNEILSCPEMQQLGITMDGAFAEYIAVPSRLVIPVPEDMPADVAALTEPVACVVRAARKSKVGLGQSVVVLGAGPIGNLHIQLMRLVGAAPIIVMELSELRAEMARAAGADAVVTDPAKLHETVLAMTAGRGADVVIESVGAPALYAEAFKLIRRGGHVAFFGITGPGASVPVDIVQTILREDSLKGSVAGMGEDMHDALTLLAHGRFATERFTEASFALSDIQQAFDSVPQRPQHLKTQIVF